MYYGIAKTVNTKYFLAIFNTCLAQLRYQYIPKDRHAL